MTKLFKTVLVIVMMLSSCANNDRQNNSSLTRDTTALDIKNKNLDTPIIVSYFKIKSDSIIISPFEIEVSLSPKAKEKIIAEKETIIVDVFFTGIPKDNSHTKFEEDGSFYVVSAQKEILYGQVASFDSIKFSKKIYDQLANKDIELGVNVYSGRKSSQDNLLNCEPLFDKISNVANKKFTLKGKLIYGDD